MSIMFDDGASSVGQFDDDKLTFNGMTQKTEKTERERWG